MILVCGSSGIIFTGYGITMMRIEIPPVPQARVCTHTLRDLKRLSVIQFEMLSDP
jgi:hypothetical protein